ncbi:MAG: hypothetical protein GY759_03775 [Chloroflexi bacterium]|nr:hypothetical protein [Chloroflexota bacterium]
MPDIPNPKDAAELLTQLRRQEELSHRPVEGQALPPQMAMFRTWQAQRVSTTHADFLKSKRYGRASRFFLDDIYAAKDFSQRNHDIERMHDFMLRFLPAAVLATLTKAIELNSLTEELDARLLTVLIEELGMTDSLTAEQYAEGYRICDNYAERQYQIELTADVGYGIERLVRIPFIGWTLRMAKRPALRGGWHELQSFLERGYKAFKHMGKAGYFLDTLKQREMQILDQIFAGEPNPFE